VSALAFSPRRRLLAAATNGHVLIFNARTGVLVRDLPEQDTDNDPSLSFVTRGRTLAVRTDQGVFLWNPRTAALKRALVRPDSSDPGQIEAIAPNGRSISEVIRDLAGDEWVTSVRLQNGTATRFAPMIGAGHSGGPILSVRGIDYSPDGRILSVHIFADYSSQSSHPDRMLSGDEYWRFYDTRTGRLIGRTPDNVASYGPLVYTPPVVFSPNGRYLALVDANRRRASLYSLARKDTLPSFDKPAGTIPISPTCLSFSPDGRSIATGSRDCCVKLWRTGQVGIMRSYRLLAGHTGNVTAIAFSSDSRLLASAAADGTIRLWRVGR